MSKIEPTAAASTCPNSALPTRRDLIKRATGAALIGATASAGLFDLFGQPRAAWGAEAAVPAATPETRVGQLFKSLNPEQRKTLCFPFGHELQSKVNNNWFIIDKNIGQLLTPDQQDLVKQIFMGMHTPEYAQKVYDQVEHDGGGKGTFKECAIAMFGEPDITGDASKGKFEFVLTGRHCTRRCDGNSVEGAAFGGPIFYGHAAESFNEKPDHKGNIYWYQALAANNVYKALDGKQQKLALLGDPRKEQATKTVALSGSDKNLVGIPMTELSKDQQGLVRKTLADLLAPFRKSDADEALKLVDAGGFDHLHLSFYKNMDIGNDGVWDVWQIEGPNMLWYFRGAPHVHTWVNIRDPNVKA